MDRLGKSDRAELTGVDEADALIALEPRIAFDAAAAAEIADDVADASAQVDLQPDEPQSVEDSPEFAIALSELEAPRSDIVFIDVAVENLDQLLETIPANAEIVFLSDGEDGVQQIADTLFGRSGIDSIHIISHGEPGELSLGSATLSAETMGGIYADALAAIGSALSENGDILIYGCDFGADATAVSSLALATGADVAASDDDTGLAARGGDWQLEVAEGSIEASAIDGGEWDGILATTAPAELNSSNLPLDSDLTGVLGQTNVSGTVGPFGLNQGVTFDVDFELTGDSEFASGIQYREAFGIDFIQFQPVNTDFPNGDLATYTFDFSQPILDLSFDFGGLDNADTVRMTAFLNGVQVELTADMFSDFSGGVFVSDVTDGSVTTFGPSSGNGNPQAREFTFSIGAGVAVDEIRLETGKGNGDNNTVTLGAYNFAWGLPDAAADNDGDGVADGDDIDDDNDGITDVDEGLTTQDTDGQLLWSHNLDGGTSTAGEIQDFAGPNPISNVVASVGDATVGLGLEVLTGDPSNDQSSSFEFDLAGSDASTLAEAIQNNEFIEVTFTTQDDVVGVINNAFHSFTGQNQGGSNLGDYVGSALVSRDGFITSESLYEDFQFQPGDPNQSFNGNFPAITPVRLEAGTTYAIRFYVYDVAASQSGRLTFSDQFVQVGQEVSPDSDGDGFFDHLDIDKDNDGITDNVEAQTTADYIAPSGQGAAFIDANNDGLDDNFDAGVIAGGMPTGVGFTEVDTDGDTVVDTLDDDSDNDAIDDVAERGGNGPTATPTGPFNDADGDGLLDEFEGSNINDGFDVNDQNIAGDNGGADGGFTSFTLGDTDNGGAGDTAADGSDAVPGIQDLDYRDSVEPQDDSASTDEDTPVTFNVTGNDTDPNNLIDPTLTQILDPVDGLLKDSVTIVGEGTYVANDNGTVTFTPAPNFNGVSTVRYSVSSADGGSNLATITVTVEPTPEGGNVAETTPEDTPVSINPLDNEDPNDVAFVTITSADLPDPATVGVFTYTADGGGIVTLDPGNPDEVLSPDEAASLTFTPVPNFNGLVPPVGFVVEDTNGDTAIGTMEVTVTPVNDPPVANDDTFALDEDGFIVLDPVGDGTAFDPDGDNVIITAIDGQSIVVGQTITISSGSVLLNADGTLTFTPAPDFNGPANFDYTVEDPSGLTATGTLSGLVDPEPEDDAIIRTTAEDSPVSVNPLTGQEDGTVASVTIDDLPDPAQGTLFFTPDGQVTPIAVPEDTPLSPTEAASIEFRPAPNFNGTVPQFESTVTDLNGDTSTVTIDITVTPVNDPPTADDETFTILQDAGPLTIDVLTGDVDPDGDLLTITEIDGTPITPGIVNTIILADGSGTVELAADGVTLTFTPTPGYNGPSTFIYEIQDPSGAATTATVSGEVDPVAVPAALIADTPEDTPLLIDPTEGQTPGVIESVIINSVPPLAQGTLTFTRGGIEITITAADLGGGVNDTLTEAEAATLTFNPAQDFNGPVDANDADVGDTLLDFTLVSNGGATMVAGTYDLTVIPVNDPPVADDETFTVDEDAGPVVIDVITGDTDLENPNDLFVSEINGTPVVAGDTVDVGNGTATLNADGTISFTPDPDYNGPISFEYTVSDPDGGTDTGRVNGLIEPLPEGGDVPETTPEDTPVSINPLENEDPGTVTSVTIPSAGLPDPATVGVFTYTDDGGGIVTLDPANADEVLSPAEAATLTFTPATNFNGIVPPVPFTVTDTNGDTAGGNLLLTVTPVNDPPVALDDSFEATEDTPLNIDIIGTLVSDLDNLNSELTITSIAGQPAAVGAIIPVANGTVTVNFDGTVTFTPDADYFGPASFTYTVSDPSGLSDTATIDITVDGIPDLVNEAFTVKEDGTVGVPITANDDLANGPAVIALDSVPTAAQGTLTFTRGGVTVTIDPLNPPTDLTRTEAGTLSFVPAPDFTGPVDNIEYTVTDADGDVASATATIVIDPVPDAVDDVFVAEEDTPLPLNLIGNDDLGDGLATLTIDSIPDAAEGTLTFTNQAGATITIAPGTVLSPTEAATLTFVPVDDFFGPVTQFSYTVADTNGDTSTADVDITVNGLPEPRADIVTTDEDTPVLVNIVANDDLGDGPALIALDTVPPATQGILTFTRGGVETPVDPANPPADLTAAEAATLTFTPAPDFDGTVDPIAYTVTDANGDSASSTATVIINPLPDPVADVFTTKEDTPLDLPLVDNDDPGDGILSLTIGTVPPASEGVLSYVDAAGNDVEIADGDQLTAAEAATISFTPTAGFSGPVTQFTYEIEDLNGDVAEATVDITVDATPDVADDALQGQENEILPLNPLANDPDFGDGIDVVVIDTLPPSSQGQLTFLQDGTGNLVTVVIGDELSEAEMNTLTFVPATDFNGTVAPFDYTVRDLNGDEATATISIGIAALVDAEDDSVTTPENTPVSLDPLTNDDPGGPDATVTIDTAPDPAQGTLSYTDATGVVQPLVQGDTITTEEFASLVFTPVTDFQGPVDPINYTINDPAGNVDSATIAVLVDGLPEAENDVFAGKEDTDLPLPILANDDQGDGPATTRFDTIPDPAQGIITYVDAGGVLQTVVAGDVLSVGEVGTLVFTPAADFNGTVPPVAYTLTDSDGDTSSATISIRIDAVPDLVPDVLTTDEDTDLPLPILANDDVGGGLASVTIDTIPAANEGILTFVDAGGVKNTVIAGDVLSPAEVASLTFEPAPNFFGPVTQFGYTVTDNNGDTDATTVDITVNGLPELVADLFTTDEDSPVLVNIVANDDLGDGPAVIALNTVPPLTQGALTFTDAETGVKVTIDPANPPSDMTRTELATLLFTPVPDFDGAVDVITYTVTDANGDTASSTAQIVINPLPDPIADAVTTNEDTPILLPLLANDDDGDGLATLTIDTLPNPLQGALTYTDAGGIVQPVVAGDPLSPAEAATITFTPAADFSGPVPAIPYTITDTTGDSASSTVSVTVDAVPDPVDDIVTTPEETPVSINVLGDNGNGLDDTGDGVAFISFDVLPPAAQGVLTYVDAAGVTQTVIAGEQLDPDEAVTLVFTPDPAFNGPVAAIPYTITDTNGDTGSAAIRITVDGIPDVLPDIYVAPSPDPIPVNFLENDPDFGDGFDFATIINAPLASEGVLTYTADGGGVVTVADGEQLSQAEMATLMFDPNDAFFGPITPINYSVTDIDGDVAATTANISVQAVTDVEPDALLTKEDTPVDLQLVDNDTIADINSTVTIGAVIPSAAQGTLSYIDDATGATVTIAANDTLSVAELATITFTPAAGFTGTVTNFDYTVTATPAGGGTTDTATVMIVVDPVPEAVNDQYTTKEDTDVAIPVNANDDNGTGFASIQFTSLPNTATEGDVLFSPDGGGGPQVLTTGDVLSEAEAATLIFRPVADFNGSVATFQYVLTDLADGNGVQDTDPADVEITVDAVPDPVLDERTVQEDTPLDIDIIGNDDVGDGLASVTILNLPDAAQGVLSFIDGAGVRQPVVAGVALSPSEIASLRFTPAPDFFGAIPDINYRVTDTNGDTGDAILRLTMNPLPDVAPDVFSTKEDTSVAVNPLTNDEADLGGDRAAALIDITAPPAAQGILFYTNTGGATVIFGDGQTLTGLTAAEVETLTFAPAPDFSGDVDPIPYTVTDANGDTASTTISITVDAVPDAVDEAFTITEDTPRTFSVIANDDQGDGPAVVQFAAIPNPAQGVLTYVSDAGVVRPVDPAVPLTAREAGRITFTPAPNFDGVIPPLDYVVRDQNGDEDVGTLTLTMNPAPDATTDVLSTKEDTPLPFNPLANDGDQGDGPATISLTGPPAAQGVISFETTPGDAGTRIDIAEGVLTAGLTPDQVATFVFTPAAGFDGTVDTIPYTVTDATGDTATALIIISIDPVPDLTPDVLAGEQDTPLPLAITDNDDLGDGLASLRFDTIPAAAEGQLTVVDGGVRRPVVAGEELSSALVATLRFDPAPGFFGDIGQIAYSVTDNSGDVDSTTVDIFIDPAPAPIADFGGVGVPGESLTIDILANDNGGDIIDPTTVKLVGTVRGGDPLIVPGEGTWTIDPATGALTFTPEAGFVGDPTPVEYTVRDDDGDLSVATSVTLDYAPVADADVAGNQPPGPVTVDILANDANGDAVDPTTVQLVGTAAPGAPLVVRGEGTWTIDRATGALTFRPEAGFTSDPTPVSYTVADDEGNRSDPASVTIDYAPVATPDVVTGATPGQPTVIDILGNDGTGDDVDPTTVQLVGTANPGDPLVVPGQGVWTVDPVTGAVTFTPEAGFLNNPTPIQYTVADDEGNRSAPSGISIAYLNDVNAGEILASTEISFGDRFDEPDQDRRELRVDPIVRETADFQSPLGSITPLDAEFPITSAVNSLISLNGTEVLPTEGVENFGGLAAPYPITIAVMGVDPGDFFPSLTGFGTNAFDELSKSIPSDLAIVDVYFLVGFDRILVLIAGSTDAGTAELILLAEEKGVQQLSLTMIAVASDGTLIEGMDTGTDEVIRRVPLGQADAAQLFIEVGDDSFEGTATIGAEGEVKVTLTGSKAYDGFSGQISGIINSQAQEMAMLKDALA